MLKKWFEKLKVDLNSSEDTTNATLDYLSSFEELSYEDKEFLRGLNYTDTDIETIEEIMEQDL